MKNTLKLMHQYSPFYLRESIILNKREIAGIKGLEGKVNTDFFTIFFTVVRSSESNYFICS